MMSDESRMQAAVASSQRDHSYEKSTELGVSAALSLVENAFISKEGSSEEAGVRIRCDVAWRLDAVDAGKRVHPGPAAPFPFLSCVISSLRANHSGQPDIHGKRELCDAAQRQAERLKAAHPPRERGSL
jgi:hypothetical protein